MGPFGIGGRESNTVFDATFTVATFDAKVTILAPVWVPTVGDFPVVTARGVRAPAYDAYGVPSFHATADMVVDTTDVVGKVRVDGEGRFDGSTFHDGFLDALLAGSGLNLAGEAPFVGSPIVVGCGGIGVAFSGGHGGRLLHAAGFAFGGVRVFALGTVVVAMGQGEVAAQTFLAVDGVGLVDLATGDGTRV